VLVAFQALAAGPSELPDWILASTDARAVAGQPFEILLVSASGEPPPDEINVRLKGDLDERILRMQALGPALGTRRAYSATMPAGMSGAVAIDLVGQASSVLVVRVAPKPDAVRTLTDKRAPQEYEPPLSENDPTYFVLGARSGYTARFQLSFKYRLFDQSVGFGQDRPWLSGLYFGYTQNSLWDLSSQSRAFRDTSYRPSLFWKWERTDDKTWIDAARFGIEHESNGKDGDRSRSINMLFIRPEWHWGLRNGDSFQFTPHVHKYFDKGDNPDIAAYRGYVDWRARYDASGEWIATGVTRIGTSGKGSLLIDFSKRTRDLRFGPVGGYLHVQYFNGYGEDILDYNVRRKPQLRVGVAIVP
jgi:outer membrane phospholipase A